MLGIGRSYGAILAAISAMVPGVQSLVEVAQHEQAAMLLPDLEAARPTGKSGTDFKVTHLISPRYQRDLHFGRRDVHNHAWRQWAKLNPL